MLNPIYKLILQAMAINTISTFDINTSGSVRDKIYINEVLKDSLLDILPVGISFLNSDFKVMSMNPYLEKILEMTHDNFLKGMYKKRQYIDINNVQMSFDQFPSTRAIKEKKIIKNIEVGIIKEDGKTIWVKVTAAPISVGDLACIIVTIDITISKEIEIQLKITAEEKEKIREKLATATEELSFKADALAVIAADTKKMNDAMINRELKMIELKAENKLLKFKLAQNIS